jgi:CheY-like chemotaxis protein
MTCWDRVDPIAASVVRRGNHVTVLAGISVLVVDDDADNLELLSFAVEHAGGMARGAKDGIAALEVLGTWLPDILLVDLAMPDVDGYELLATVRTSARLRHIPAVAVTAHAFDGVKERCIEAGFADHIAKPVDVPLLMAVIRSLAMKL